MCLQEIAVDVINEFPRGLNVPNHSTTLQSQSPPPANINTKFRPHCKAHIMELFPDLFEGIGTLKNVVEKLDVDNTITPVVQPPRKIPQVMVEPLKQEMKG